MAQMAIAIPIILRDGSISKTKDFLAQPTLALSLQAQEEILAYFLGETVDFIDDLAEGMGLAVQNSVDDG